MFGVVNVLARKCIKSTTTYATIYAYCTGYDAAAGLDTGSAVGKCTLAICCLQLQHAVQTTS